MLCIYKTTNGVTSCQPVNSDNPLPITGAGSGTVGTGTAGQVAYYPSTGTTIASTPNITVGTTGLVGIGTSVSVNTLDVYGNEAIGVGYAGVSAAPTNGLIVSGNVGIGTTNPDPLATSTLVMEVSAPTVGVNSEIDIASASSSFLGAGSGGSFSLGYNVNVANAIINQSIPQWRLRFPSGGGSFDIESSPAGSTYSSTIFLYVNNSGQIGLGTTSPLAKLDVRGTTSTNGIISNGTTFTIASGCGTPTSLTGGATAGSFVSQAATCTPVITFATAVLHGYHCEATDENTGLNMGQTGHSTTTCTMSGTTTIGDVISFNAMGY